MSGAMLQKVESPALTEAIRLVHQGDGEAFSLIYRSYSELVRRVCLRMLRDSAEAEDAAQDVFLRVFLKINTFRGESAFSSWLYRLTTNVVLMRFRKKKHNWALPTEYTSDDAEPGSEIGAPDVRLTGMLGWIDIEAAVDSLPRGNKAAFILHDVYGYDHKEIAELLGYSVGNSKSQVHRARRRLRKLLGDAHQRGHQVFNNLLDQRQKCSSGGENLLRPKNIGSLVSATNCAAAITKIAEPLNRNAAARP
jgi:RNA polymerase sigma-70 factor (ECF subfamily)